MVELITPYLSASGGIVRFLGTRGEGLHHVAFQCEDLPTCLSKLRDCGIKRFQITRRPGQKAPWSLFFSRAKRAGC